MLLGSEEIVCTLHTRGPPRVAYVANAAAPIADVGRNKAPAGAIRVDHLMQMVVTHGNPPEPNSALPGPYPPLPISPLQLHGLLHIATGGVVQYRPGTAPCLHPVFPRPGALR